MPIRNLTALAAGLATSCFASFTAHSNPKEKFHQGKTVTIVVAAEAGGGHHKWSLFLTPYWGETHAR